MGRYELLAEIGRGGMGVVYRAWDPELGREVALKILGAGPHVSDASRLRFLREARAAARMAHPAIVRVYDIGEHEGCAWFTMPYVAGPTLSERLKQGPVPPEQAASWVAQVARALHHAHTEGLIHRDVKPANILLEGGTLPLLTDFGLVRHVEAHELTLTRESQILGTPAYMSPEQAMGEEIGPLSDQYALGVVLYELLAGGRPFRDVHPAVVLRRIIDEEPPPITTPGTPRALATIAMRALSRAPAGRYLDCAALADDLERYLRGEEIHPSTTSSVSRVRRLLTAHRRPLRVAERTGLLVAGLATVAALGVWWQDLRSTRAREAEAARRGAALEQRLGELYATGEIGRADAAFASFAAFEGNADTTALSAAWRTLGRLRASEGDIDGALDALASAWLQARDPGQQIAALQEMATLYRRTYAWPELRAAVTTLDELGAAAAVDAAGWRRDLALTDWDIEAALAQTPDVQERALIARLGQGTPTAHRGDAASAWDIDGDGRDEILFKSARSSELTVLDSSAPNLPVRGTLAGVLVGGDGGVRPFPPAPGRRPLLLIAGHPSRIYGVDDALRPVELAATDNELGAVTAGDLDGDGAIEHYLAGADQLLRLDVVGDELRLATAPSRVPPAGMLLSAATALDADGDGRQELVLGTGPWSGYDLRVLEQDGAALALRTRRRLGEVQRVVSIRTHDGPAIVALKLWAASGLYNLQLFRADEPQGEPRGLHVLKLTATGLERRALLPLPTPAALPSTAATREPIDNETGLFGADLDGDNLDEVIYGSGGGWTTVFLQRPDGRFTDLSISGVYPLTTAQLDDDPESELVVMRTDQRHDIWTLGVGDARPPAEPRVVPTPPQRPADLAPDLRVAWDRAEALVGVGQARAAAARLESLASMAQAPAVAAAVQLRAASLYEQTDEPWRATSLYRAAAQRPEHASVALGGALRSAISDLDYAGALAAARAHAETTAPSAPQRDLIARLERQLASPEVHLDLRAALDPRWHVLSPLGVHWRPGQGLEVATSEHAPILELPVRWDGGPMLLELSAVASRLDWGGTLWLELVDPETGASGDELSLYRVGGGGVLIEAARCSHNESGFSAPNRPGVIVGRPVVLRWEYDPEQQRGACTLQGTDGLDTRRIGGAPARPYQAGRLLLRLTGDQVYPSLSAGLITGIRLRGLTPLDEAATAPQEAWRLLAVERTSEALDLLRGLPGGRAALGRALALEATGRRDEALSTLRAALARDPTLEGETGRLIRQQLDPFEPALRAALGRAYFPTLWQHSEDLIVMHPDEAPTATLLTRHLDGIEEIETARLASTEDALAIENLRSRRGEAWRRAGRLEAAQRDLERARANAAERLGRTDDPEMATRLRRVLTFSLRGLARIALARQDTATALETLRYALSVAVSEVTLADLLAVDPELDALRARPDWAPFEAVRRVWPAEIPRDREDQP